MIVNFNELNLLLFIYLFNIFFYSFSLVLLLSYRNIPKIRPRAYIFQRPFLRGLYSEGFMYGGKFGFQKSIGLALFLEGNLPFFFVLLCIWGQFPSTSPPGRLYLEGRFNGGFLALGVWGGRYIWGGLYIEGLLFGILRYLYIYRIRVTTARLD